ncbi:hypothetical protein BKA62DRAFT_783550 [Auriculariales sp. MPI-PUGE-AT-0066]|nr:hypothetical protein BKA62DRAFT_783550 [Auriculariales sp. MPI-PUGE-AT-0066]
MFSFRTLLTYVQHAAADYTDKPVFFIPKELDDTPSEWEPVSYTRFSDDLERAASYWTSFFGALGIARGATVGLWLNGYAYSDIVHLFALSALLDVNGTKYLIYGPPTAAVALQLHELTPGLRLFEHPELSVIRKAPRQQDPFHPSGDDIVVIFHTSGSTGPHPKLVPYTHRFLDAALKKMNHVWTTFGGTRSTQMGSVMFTGSLSKCGAIVLPHPDRVPYTSDDLIFLHGKGLMDSACILAPQLRRYLTECETNRALLEVFVQLRRIMFTGATLFESDLADARSHGINLMQAYASSELSRVMYSSESDLVMRTIPGFNYSFVPVDGGSSTDAVKDRMFELVVPAGAPDLPHPSLLNRDGSFHTGDLFREVQPGAWEFCGRTDDMIKMYYGNCCETKSIEADVLATCFDIVQTCFIAGSGRIAPVLFVELQVDGDDAWRWTSACEIARRLEPSQRAFVR